MLCHDFTCFLRGGGAVQHPPVLWVRHIEPRAERGSFSLDSKLGYDGMTALSDAALAEFVATSAAILGLQLDDQELAAARDTMRGLLNQAALVLDYSQPPVGT